MKVVEVCALAGLDECLANVPTMWFLKLRWVLAEVSRFGREGIMRAIEAQGKLA